MRFDQSTKEQMLSKVLRDNSLEVMSQRSGSIRNFEEREFQKCSFKPKTNGSKFRKPVKSKVRTAQRSIKVDITNLNSSMEAYPERHEIAETIQE